VCTGITQYENRECDLDAKFGNNHITIRKKTFLYCNQHVYGLLHYSCRVRHAYIETYVYVIIIAAHRNVVI